MAQNLINRQTSLLHRRYKAILALGVILGGASVFVGEAKAFSITTLQCFFNGGTGATPPPGGTTPQACNSLPNEIDPSTPSLWESISTNKLKLGDKLFSFLGVSSPSNVAGHVEFTWIDTDSGVTTYGDDTWSVTTIFDSPVVGESGWIDYSLQITDPDWQFSGVKLDSQVLSEGGVTVEKFINDPTFTPPAYLTSLNGEPEPVPPALKPLGGTVITVRDKWTVDQDGALTSIVNTYTQTTQTPGPLPLLGAGAAFGFSRRLRSRIRNPRLRISGLAKS